LPSASRLLSTAEEEGELSLHVASRSKATIAPFLAFIAKSP
jgi:hypothetical protein